MSDVPTEAAEKDLPPPPELFHEGVPTIRQRIEGVLLRPAETFAALDERAGLLAPWLLALVVGVAFGLVGLSRIDYKTVAKDGVEEGFRHLTPQQVRAMGGESKVEELKDQMIRWQAFAMRGVLLAGPTIGTLLSGLVVGGTLFAASALLGGRKDLLRALVVAFHANLVSLVAYAAKLAGVLSGNPLPRTSLGNLVESSAKAPVLAWALDAADPIYWWWVVLLGMGLHFTMGVRRGRAVLATVVLSLLPLLALLALVAVGKLSVGGGS